MTDIEQLAAQTIEHVETCFQFGYDHKIIIDRAISTAYNKGRASATSEARKAASRANGAKAKAPNTVFRGGRKKGSRDKAPRNPGRWAHKTNETNETEIKP